MATSNPSNYRSQLEALRAACFNNASAFVKVVPGVLPIIAAGSPLDQRRWGASFLAEAFASPLMPADDKLNLALQSVSTVRGYFDTQDEDSTVIKSAVQVATSIYPLVFKHNVYNANDAQAWQNMVAIKSSILRRMDCSPSGVRVCCVKFVQRVVQVQTQGLIADPRRPDQNEISLALVNNHPLLAPQNLEAEALGLLDRLLSVFQEAHSDALYVTATLNCLSTLVRTRPSIASRIVNTIFNFNPFRAGSGPLSPKTKTLMRSMERTVRAFLMNLTKSNTSPSFQQRVQEYVEHMKNQRQLAMDDSRKRAAPVEPTDGLSDNKRQKLAEGQSATPQYPSLPEGPVTLAQVFTLTADPRVRDFDVTKIPLEIVLRVLEPLLKAIPQQSFDHAINFIRTRWLDLSNTTSLGGPDASGSPGALASARQGLSTDEDDDLEAQGPIAAPSAPPFRLPQPPPRTPAENDAEVQYRVNKMFARLRTFKDAGTPIDTFLKKGPPSTGRRAANTDDRDSWAMFMLRTALRSKIGRFPHGVYNDTMPYIDYPKYQACLATLVREGMLKWTLENFRRRIDVAALWMTEEYVLKYDHAAAGDNVTGALGAQYDKWSLRLIDGMMPYVDANDWKYVTRFYSEMPAVRRAHVERLGRMAQDPDRVGCALRVLQYLVMFKPPCRDACLDVVEDMYKNNEPARAEASRLLFDRRKDALTDEDRDALEKAKADKAAAKIAKPAA